MCRFLSPCNLFSMLCSIVEGRHSERETIVIYSVAANIDVGIVMQMWLCIYVFHKDSAEAVVTGSC